MICGCLREFETVRGLRMHGEKCTEATTVLSLHDEAQRAVSAAATRVAQRSFDKLQTSLRRKRARQLKGLSPVEEEEEEEEPTSHQLASQHALNNLVEELLQEGGAAAEEAQPPQQRRLPDTGSDTGSDIAPEKKRTRADLAPPRRREIVTSDFLALAELAADKEKTARNKALRRMVEFYGTPEGPIIPKPLVQFVLGDRVLLSRRVADALAHAWGNLNPLQRERLHDLCQRPKEAGCVKFFVSSTTKREVFLLVEPLAQAILRAEVEEHEADGAHFSLVDLEKAERIEDLKHIFKPQKKSAPTCFRCGKEGHVKRNCPLSASAARAPTSVKSGKSSVVCFLCGEAGHFKKNCPKRNTDQK